MANYNHYVHSLGPIIWQLSKHVSLAFLNKLGQSYVTISCKTNKNRNVCKQKHIHMGKST